MYILAAIASCLISLPLIRCAAQPEQVHLSYGGSESVMLVTWVSLQQPQSAQVQFSPIVTGPIQPIDGNVTQFVDGGIERRKIFVCRAAMTNLIPGQKYYYRVGNDGIWSPTFHFKALKEPTDGYRFAVFGDFGLTNARSLARLIDDVHNERIQMVLHVGDFAYDMHDDNGRTADKFFNQIEPLAAHVPYMALPGNHEESYNFSNYVNRFTMPDSESNHYYSFNLGPVHFVPFSTEFYYYTQYGTQQIANQYNWLLHDLIGAVQNRAKVPWIIAMGHRPMYCSNADHDDCTKTHTRTRTGMPVTHKFGLEQMFKEHGVDLEIWAHEHSYERLWPLYNRTIYNGTDEPYHNPPAPTHIITGSAGCREDHDDFQSAPLAWSAYRSTQYGYSRMNVRNKTHLYWEQISDEQGGAVIDSIWLVRDTHDKYEEIETAKGTFIS